jgi:hypothetical protein
MNSARTKLTLAATVAAALTLTLVAGVGAAQASNATSAASILATINKARVADGNKVFVHNGYLSDYAQEVSANYAAHGVAGLTAPTADKPPQLCLVVDSVVTTAIGPSAATTIAAKFSGSHFGMDNYGAVGYTVEGWTAYAVYVAMYCDLAPNDKITPGTVELSGTPQVGQQLTAEVSGFALSDPTSPISSRKLEYSWSETSPSGFVTQLPDTWPIYFPSAADIGTKITVTVKATAPSYAPVSATSAYSTPVVAGVLPSPKMLTVS